MPLIVPTDAQPVLAEFRIFKILGDTLVSNQNEYGSTPPANPLGSVEPEALLVKFANASLMALTSANPDKTPDV